MSETVTVIYYGPAVFSGVLAQCLEDEGLDVEYETPLDAPRDAAKTVSLVLAAIGRPGEVRARATTAVRRFRGRGNVDLRVTLEGGEAPPD
jgi:hypothetical protein